jgi:hypothetical protein
MSCPHVLTPVALQHQVLLASMTQFDLLLLYERICWRQYVPSVKLLALL